MPVKAKSYLVRYECTHCGSFFYAKHRRKYCSSDCSDNGQGGADRHNRRMEKDPTPEQIAEMCMKIRSGEIVVNQGVGSKTNRQKPSWVLEKKLK